MDVTTLPAWKSLARHRADIENTRITQLFEDEPGRSERLTLKGGGLTFDVSRNLASRDTFARLYELADAVDLADQRNALFRGDTVNESEARAALHMLLRTGEPAGHPAAPEVADTLARMETISRAVRDGSWKGSTGEPIRHVVHIGVGGSYLGPRMAAEALTYFRPDATTGRIADHYVANIDGHHIDRVLAGLPAAQTLVVIVSKTFTTLETRANAETARTWLQQQLPGADLSRHFIAVSTNLDAAGDFGVTADHTLPLWDFVGGRYSMWSAVGLPLAITHGFETFRRMLDGAAAMDHHFATAPHAGNLPLTAALLSVWYNCFFEAQSHAVIPYDHFLRLLPAHLQQLEMESLGKSVTQDGKPLAVTSGQILWGGEGSNGQHAFHQLLYQGNRFVPIDFILPLRARHALPGHHEWLVANCLGQAEALMQGLSADEVAANLAASGTDDTLAAARRPHMTHAGNRPSSIIALDSVTPESLGALVAFYEHKVFCQAAVWHINPFDQWGVEYGKQLSRRVFARIQQDPAADQQPVHQATEQLIDLYRKAQNPE